LIGTCAQRFVRRNGRPLTTLKNSYFAFLIIFK
jgi:hypothetical protein